MIYKFRKAMPADASQIWIILQQAIIRRKNDGSNQWQDGYPNEQVVQNDITNEIGYVLTDENNIIGYAAIIFNDEPAYENIKGTWLTNGDFLVVHRVAITDDSIGQGLAQKIFLFIEELAKKHNINSIKVDTNFDNLAMLNIFKKLDYIYCGEVILRDGLRKAFEKNF